MYHGTDDKSRLLQADTAEKLKSQESEKLPFTATMKVPEGGAPFISQHIHNSILCSLLLHSYRATWTRSTRTNSAGFPWRSKSLFRTAAKPSLVTTTESSFRPRPRRNSTTRPRSPRTTRRRALRKKSTTRPFERHGTLALCLKPRTLNGGCVCEQWTWMGLQQLWS